MSNLAPIVRLVTSLAAIVPATDNPATLDRCLSAIGAANDPPERVIVVDEAPAPGPAAARNTGGMGADADVLVFVDADVLVHPDAFTRVRRAFERDPGLGAVFGSYDDEPAAAGVVSVFRNLLHHHVHQGAAGPASTFWAGLGAIRRHVFEEHGGFDAKRYPRASIEDIELGCRLSAAGVRIEVDPELLGTHLKQWSLASMIETDFSRRGAPWVALMLGSEASRSALNLGWRHRLSAAAVGLGALALARGNRRTAAASLAALLVLNRDFYRLLQRRQGAAGALAGVGLHALHHATGIAAVPGGVLLYLRGH
jgi:GT2 family glycosyltransferase